MAEKRLDIVIGTKGDQQAAGAFSRLGMGLKNLKKETEGLRDFRELFTSGILVAGLDRGVRALAEFAKGWADVAAGTKTAKENIRELLEKTPLVGAGIELGKGIKAWMDPEGEAAKAAQERASEKIAAEDKKLIAGARAALLNSRRQLADERGRIDMEGLTGTALDRARAQETFRKKGSMDQGSVYDALIGQAVLAGAGGDMALKEELEKQAQQVLDLAQEELDKAMEKAAAKDKAANEMSAFMGRRATERIWGGVRAALSAGRSGIGNVLSELGERFRPVGQDFGRFSSAVSGESSRFDTGLLAKAGENGIARNLADINKNTKDTATLLKDAAPTIANAIAASLGIPVAFTPR